MIREPPSGTKLQRANRPEAVSAEARKRGFEPTDVPAGGIGLALLGLYVFLGLSGAAVAGLLLLFKGQEHGQAPAFAPATPPPPRLEIDPLANRLAQEAPALRDVAQIEAAMRAVAAAGWPDAAPPPSTAETAKAHAEEAR